MKIKFSNLLMTILDSTLTCSNLAVETQSHQLLLSGIKHLNNKCVAVLLTLRNILRQLSFQSILKEQFSIQHCNISANGFSSFWKWSYPISLWTVTLSHIHATNMPKLTNKNTKKTSKNLTPLNLQLILNTHTRYWCVTYTSIHCSIKRCVATTQIMVSEYP